MDEEKAIRVITRRLNDLDVKLDTLVSDADAAVGNVLSPKTFYSVVLPKKTGTMPTVAIASGSNAYPAGYHAGNAGGLSAVDADLIAVNIKSGVQIFGVDGTLSAGGMFPTKEGTLTLPAPTLVVT